MVWNSKGKKSQDKRILLEEEPGCDSKRHTVVQEKGRLAQVTALIYRSKGYNAFGVMGQPRTSVPFRDAATTFPAPCVLWRATCTLSRSVPSGTSRGCGCRRYEGTSSAHLSLLWLPTPSAGRVPFPPAHTTLLVPATSSLELQVRGFRVTPEAGRFGGTLQGDVCVCVPFSPVPCRP